LNDPTGGSGIEIREFGFWYAKVPKGVAAPPPQVPVTTAPVPAALAPLDPQQLAAVLYDKAIPLGYSTRSQWGGRIIEGPVFDVVNNERVVSFIAGYYIPVNFWDATRTVVDLSFRGQLAWRQSTGALMSGLNVGVATVGGAQTVRFVTGTLAQTPDAWSVARYGAQAVAYVPLVTATFENIRIAQFGNIVPFTSVSVEDTAVGLPGDLAAWADAIEALARHDGRGPEEFETVDVSGGINALILGSKINFIGFLSGMRKHKPQWNIRSGEKLSLIEKAGLSLDLTLELAKLVKHDAQPIVVHTSDAFDNPREKVCHYLDVDRDYEPSNARISEDLDPVVQTDALQSDSYEIPVASTADIVNTETSFAYYTEEVARQKSEFTGMAYYLGLEPGDCYKWTSAAGRTYYHRVNEIVRRADFTVDAKGEGFLNCAIEGPPAGAAVPIPAGLMAPMVRFTNAGATDTLTGNFGQAAFAFTPPPGFGNCGATFDGTPAAGVVMSNGNLTVTHGTTNNGAGVSSTTVLPSGRFYFEVTVQTSVSDAVGVGIKPYSGGVFSDPAGTFPGGVGVNLGLSSYIYSDGISTGKNLGTAAVGDVFCFAIDIPARLARIRRNDGDWGG
jgi:hypothetical protein